jgi:hypothetical protein
VTNEKSLRAIYMILMFLLLLLLLLLLLPPPPPPPPPPSRTSSRTSVSNSRLSSAIEEVCRSSTFIKFRTSAAVEYAATFSACGVTVARSNRPPFCSLRIAIVAMRLCFTCVIECVRAHVRASPTNGHLQAIERISFPLCNRLSANDWAEE